MREVFKYIQVKAGKLIKIREIFKANECRFDKTGFYSANKDRIERVINLLADDKSKKTYKSLIKYHQTMSYLHFPFFCVTLNTYYLQEFGIYDDECFIDCGVGDIVSDPTNDTIAGYIKRYPNTKKIYVFEVDPHNFVGIKEKYGNNPQIVLFNAGVFDNDGKMDFYMCGADASTHLPRNDAREIVQIKTMKIDSLNIDKVSFIKMDVEGGELNALKGAEKTILRDKPILAISIYHSNEDMIGIAEYINSLVPEYKLYIRHHGFLVGGTILYAGLKDV